MNHELVIGYDSVPTARRVARARASILFRIVSAVISLGVVGVIVWLQREKWSSAMIWGVVGVWGGVTLVWFCGSAISIALARRDLKKIGHGPALIVSRFGIGIEQRMLSWDEIDTVKLAGSAIGSGPKLIVNVRDGAASKIPLSFLDTMPGTIDSAIRAFSHRRLHLDANGLDSMM